MDWLFFALISSLLLSLSTVVDKIMLKNHIRDARVYATFYLLSSILGVLVFLVDDIQIPSLPVLLLCFLGGATYVSAVFVLYKALGLDEPSRVTALFQLTPIFVLLMSIPLFGNDLSAFQFLGFVLLLAGAVLISVKDLSSFRFTDAFPLMLLSDFLYAVTIVLQKFAFNYLSYTSEFFWRRLSAFLCGLLVLYYYRKEVSKTVQSTKWFVWPVLVGLYILVIIALLLSTLALSLGPASLVAVASGTQAVFVLLCAALLAKLAPDLITEGISGKELSQKILSILLIMLGLFLVAK